MKGLKLYQLVILVVMALCLVSGQASAQLTYYFGEDSEFGSGAQWGGVAPTGTWATATFIDVDANNVQLTLNVTNNLSVESIGAFYFNYTGDATNLNITANDDSAVGSWSANLNDPSDPNDDTPTFQADGDGIYDILFDLPPPGGSKFQANETLTYNINYAGITASNFYELAAPGGPNGPFYAAAKLQGIPCDTSIQDCANEGGTTSSWAAGVVPEPVSSTLFLVGAATLGFRRFRKTRKSI